MSAYVILDVRLTDAARYEAYKKLSGPAMAAFGGRFLVRGGACETLEGEWSPERIVVLEFPSADLARRWWSSEEYREAKGIRQSASEGRMILVEGVAGPPPARVPGFDLEEACAVLERTPGMLRSWLPGLPEGWLDADEGPDTFSPREVLGHLIHGEQTDWIARARRILEEGPARPFEPFDRFAQRRLFAGLSANELLDRFASLRAANLATLRSWSLTREQLDLEGTHPALGTVTLRQLLATWTVHDLGHVAQIARVLAKRYAGEVGPWNEHLPVLDDRKGAAR